MRSKFLAPSEVKETSSQLHDKGKKIVLTYGTFDLIHSGHAAYLLKAKMQGDILIVAIASNKCKQILRGKGFPLIDQKNRAELLTYFDFVDYVTVADERNLLPLIKKVKPDVFYTLALDWKSHLRKPGEEKYIKKYGGRIIKNPKAKPYISAAEVVERVADLKIKEIVEYFFGKTKIDLSNGDWRKKKWSGLKTNVRSDSLHFGVHAKNLDMFARRHFADMVDLSDLKKLGDKLRREGKKVVLASGACDLIHAGHTRFYAKAKDLGDVLVLALPSNRIICKQKGRGRPVVDEYSRAELMGFFNFVDYTVIFDNDSIYNCIENLKPDVFFTVNEGWNKIEKTPEYKLMKNWKGKVVVVPPQSPKLSSSKLIKKAAGMRVREVFKEVLKEAEKFTSLKD